MKEKIKVLLNNKVKTFSECIKCAVFVYMFCRLFIVRGFALCGISTYSLAIYLLLYLSAIVTLAILFFEKFNIWLLIICIICFSSCFVIEHNHKTQETLACMRCIAIETDDESDECKQICDDYNKICIEE
ncbi:MAG: hypothetical protein MJ158_00790 [Alphaproteobacteria bacterium]|nr:hypothetical protein [Alphaproteobacteria bacterium]